MWKLVSFITPAFGTADRLASSVEDSEWELHFGARYDVDNLPRLDETCTLPNGDRVTSSGRSIGESNWACITEGSWTPRKTRVELPVALKRIIRSYDDPKIDFQREVDCLELLKGNEFIVELITCFHRKGRDYMMLNRQGPDLLTVLNRVRTGLPIPHVKRIARCALSALEHCHARGIIHCDLKPENLMFPIGGYDPDRPSDVVLIDFGSVRYTGCTDRVGSLGYIAPEVILFQPKTTACDIWSLGVVLFSARMSKGLFLEFNRVEDYLFQYRELLSNECLGSAQEMPPVRSTAWQILERIVNDDSLPNLLDRMIKWNPRERASATELLSDPFAIDE